MHDLLSNILSSIGQEDRGDYANFLEGLHCGIQFTQDGRTDTDSQAFKHGMELGEALMKLVPPEDL